MFHIHRDRFRTSIYRSVSITAAGLAALLLLGCSSSPTEPTETVAFSTVIQSSYSGFAVPRQEIIRDSGRWTDAWSEIHSGVHPVPPLPSVQFSERMLVLTAMGQRPTGCFRTEVSAIRAGDGKLEISIVESESTECGCTQAVTHPVHVVELDRREVAPLFDVRRRTVACG